MVTYIKTEKGYFYKLSKNGKKRVSKEEYNKKNGKIKNKNMTGGAIEASDIMYQDDLVCILRPDVKKGIIIWSVYSSLTPVDICKMGLKTGKQLKTEDTDYGRTVTHPYSFFRAPYVACRDIDYSTVETEISSSFGKINTLSRVYIRVDPDKTFVFSSEMRNYFAHPKWYGKPDEIYKSKKTLSEYLKVIRDNLMVDSNLPSGKSIWYDLYTSKAHIYADTIVPFYFDEHPINENSEILVSIPHLTPDYFVLCA
jgi:hypothetical protein